MRSRNHRTSQAREIITFWGIVLVACAVLCALTFVAGKYWIGGLIARSSGDNPTPKVAVKTADEARADAADDERQTDPPAQATVKMEQRAPTEGERSEIEQKYPQDGADLNKAADETGSDESTGSDSKPLDGAAPDTGGKFVVVAGSFANPDNARRELEDLAARGYSPSITKVTRNGKTFHRVSIGSYATRDEAEQARDELTAVGKPANITTR
jgi:cell division septation protein DedD